VEICRAITTLILNTNQGTFWRNSPSADTVWCNTDRKTTCFDKSVFQLNPPIRRRDGWVDLISPEAKPKISSALVGEAKNKTM